MEELRRYLLDKHAEMYRKGVTSALVEIAKISHFSDDELVKYASSRGIKWAKQ